MRIEPGTIVGGRYEIVRLLGEGGMGSVWEATHTITRKPMALKFLKREVENVTQRRRFLREARAASAVKHPNVVQIHDVFELDDGTPVMVMNKLEGETLASLLEREGPLSLARATRILLPVISAVHAAHAARIVHRDLKPENIFLLHLPPEQAGAGDFDVRVLDFGIAKMEQADPSQGGGASLTQTGAMLGTPYYMAPEQVWGESDVDARADVWALGVILYLTLSGKRPIFGDNIGQILKAIGAGNIRPLEEVAPHVPRDVCAMVGRMLRVEKSERLDDVRAVFETLRAHAGSDSASVARISIGGPTSAASDAFAKTEQAAALSGAGLSKSVTDNGATRRPRWPLAVGVVVVMAGVAIVGWRLGVGGSAPAPALASASAPASAPVPVPASALASETLPVLDSAGESPSSVVPAKPRVTIRMSATQSIAAPPPPPPSPPTPSRLPGGLQPLPF